VPSLTHLTYTTLFRSYTRVQAEKAKASFNHFSALKDATKKAAGPYGLHFGIEALTFYTGVGANHIFNLMTKYEKNPMALELFLRSEEHTSELQSRENL